MKKSFDVNRFFVHEMRLETRENHVNSNLQLRFPVILPVHRFLFEIVISDLLYFARYCVFASYFNRIDVWSGPLECRSRALIGSIVV